MYNLDEYVLPNRNSLGISFSSFTWLYSFNNKYDGWRGFYYHSSDTYFLGLPSNVANGTNRIGLMMTAFSAKYGFKSKVYLHSHLVRIQGCSH